MVELFEFVLRELFDNDDDEDDGDGMPVATDAVDDVVDVSFIFPLLVLLVPLIGDTVHSIQFTICIANVYQMNDPLTNETMNRAPPLKWFD